MKVLDLFSCIGCHAVGFHRVGGFETVAFVEKRPFRRAVLRERFPGVRIENDVRAIEAINADVVMGGPPCQETSVAAAITGNRTGYSLWPEMHRIGVNSRVQWFVVEQPTGHATWEAKVANDLSVSGFHVARLEFGACDVGAPYIRRRVFLLACASLPRLEVAWSAAPQAIERVKRAANDRGAWNTRQLAAIRVDAQSAGEMDRRKSRRRVERIEALGDSNPPEMAEVIGHCLMAATNTR
jgi:site-specific DNA-cytosine methylase